MNLESCTPGQREIVTTLDAPLMVSAGAGSGKTFTLTQRIAYALDASEGTPFAQGIDQVMAITFTKKAAAELKSRIKRLLCSLDQEDEALRVDNAWISTIHGMCARVLREHALELGIDPGFEVIGETDAGLLYDEAFDEVINITSRSGSALERELLAAMPVRSGSSGETSVESLVTAVTGRACALPAGFDALASDLPLAQPSSLVRQLVELGHEFCDCSSALSKPTKTDGKHRAAMEHALEVAQAYLSDAPEVGFCDDAFDAHRFAEAVFSFPKTSKSYRSKEDDPGFFATYREEFSSIGAEAEAGLAAREQVGVVAIAHRVAEAFARRKGPTQLDNNDLLRAAYHALSDNPAIASSYRSRFRLIMIDEFQDTDELQVAIVSALAAPGFINVCTVGDAQQSIYRFR